MAAMNAFDINEKENELLNVLDQHIGKLEWRKFQARRVKVMKGEVAEEMDRSAYPPFASFRFKHEDPVLIRKLKEHVYDYRGAVDWVMVAHEREELPKVNWMICPKVMWEARDAALAAGLSPGEYIAAAIHHLDRLRTMI